MIHDKSGRRLMTGQIVDLNLDGRHSIDGMYTGDILHVEDSSAINKTPGFAVVRVMIRVPVTILDGKERVPCYIVREVSKDAPGVGASFPQKDNVLPVMTPANTADDKSN